MAQTEKIYGFHAVTALLRQAPERVLEIWLLKGRNDERATDVVNTARKFGLSIHFSNRASLDKMSDEQQHQGVVANVRLAKPLDEADLHELLDLSKVPLLLVLDGVTDPHNLGACMRTADAAGVTAIIVPKDKSGSLNATVRKVASGAADIIPFVQVTNLVRTLKSLQDRGVWIVGTAGEATSTLFDADLKGPLAIVMGAEGKGMRRLTSETCDELIKLPMNGSVSSLNVSVATGICLYECIRQRTN